MPGYNPSFNWLVTTQDGGRATHIYRYVGEKVLFVGSAPSHTFLSINAKNTGPYNPVEDYIRRQGA